MDETGLDAANAAGRRTFDAGAMLRSRMLFKAGGTFAVRTSDILMAVLLALAAASEYMPWIAGPWFVAVIEQLSFVVIFEGAFLMLQGTLVDIATRLDKRPPLWLVPLIGAGLLMFSPHALEGVKAAWELGSAVFIPIAISLLSRFMVMWHMPECTDLQKLAARAQISNRIATGIGVLVIGFALMVVGWITGRDLFSPSIFFGLASLHFAIASYDDWRVRRPAFAENPTVLFRFDVIHFKHMYPL